MISPVNVYNRRSQGRQLPPGFHHVRTVDGNNNAYKNARNTRANSIHSTQTGMNVRVRGNNNQCEILSNPTPPMSQDVKDFWNLLDHSLHPGVSENKQNNASRRNFSSDISEKRPIMKTQYSQTNLSYGSSISGEQRQPENVDSTGRYDNIKLVLHTHEEVLGGERCIINDKINNNTCLESFDSDLEHLKNLQKCPYHRKTQYSVLSTLNLVKSRLQHLRDSCIVNMEEVPSNMSSFFS